MKVRRLESSVISTKVAFTVRLPRGISPVANSAKFQSTLPVRGATRGSMELPLILRPFQSTLPLRGATRCWRDVCPDGHISIHAPLAGSDQAQVAAFVPIIDISIHAPLAGSDPEGRRRQRPMPDFNPRSPCGERRCGYGRPKMTTKFQSTLPLRGATLVQIPDGLSGLFQSTLPLRGATNSTGIRTSSILNFNPRSPCGERRVAPVAAIS